MGRCRGSPLPVWDSTSSGSRSRNYKAHAVSLPSSGGAEWLPAPWTRGSASRTNENLLSEAITYWHGQNIFDKCYCHFCSAGCDTRSHWHVRGGWVGCSQSACSACAAGAIRAEEGTGSWGNSVTKPKVDLVQQVIVDAVYRAQCTCCRPNN